MTKISLESGNHVIGLIPAAGRATRLGELPYSKELLPVPNRGTGLVQATTQIAIESTARFLLECGAAQQHIVIAPAKQDIPNFLGDGRRLGASITYTVVANSPSVPHSLDATYDSIADNDVILVFPDILFEPRTGIAKYLSSRAQTGADVLLALVPSTRGDKVDMVSVDADGKVSKIVPKPGPGNVGWTWIAAAWSPGFSDFLHHHLDDTETVRTHPADCELYVGDVLNAAIASGLVIRAAQFADGWAIDIGTPDDFAAAWRQGCASDAPTSKV
jgi:glucose-1-phosphate thymidylyltransferase